MKRFYFSELTKGSGDTATNVNVIDDEDFCAETFLDAVNTAPSIDYSDSFFDDEPQSAPSVRIVKAVCPAVGKLSEREKQALFELCEFLPQGVCVVFYFHHAEETRRVKEYEKSTKILSEIHGILDVDFRREAPTSPLLKKWVKRHFDAKKCAIDSAGVEYLINAVGNDMSTLAYEIEKLCTYISSRSEKTVYNADIDYVCIRNTEARLDDISRGALTKDYKKAIAALCTLASEKVPETYIFGAVSNKVSELCTVEYYRASGYSPADISKRAGIRDFVVKNDITLLDSMARSSRKGGSVCDKYIKILAEYDVKLKSSAGDKYLLLQNMIFKMCV
ncbi:MAG: hypothetical protein IKV97_01205 [Clostridia bacterium]|nr:hypothetical protein [Clostridia bacterium]